MTLPARLGLICGLAAAPIFVTPAFAEEGMFFKDMLGSVGIVPKEKAPIAYRDRPNLMVPPKTGLRSPGTSTSAAGNPAWPTDPDVAAQRRAAEEGTTPRTLTDKYRMSSTHGERLTPAELQAGRVANNGSAPTPESHRGDSARDVLYLSPDQLRAKRSRGDDDTPPGVEPSRRALTDPPSGMRKSASGKPVKGDYVPTVDQQRLDANPMTWLTRRFKSDDE